MKRTLNGTTAKNMQPMKRRRRSLQAVDGLTQEANDLAARSGLSRLERRSVSKVVENQYAIHYERFRAFCRDSGVEQPADCQLDSLLTDFLDHIFLEGRHVADGEKTMASVEYHHHKVRGNLLRTRRALRGWRKEAPPQSRVLMPMLLAYGLAMALMSRSQKEMAVKVILDFDTYMRPGESIDLKNKHLVRPVKGAGPQFRWHFIIVRDFDEKQPDKVGVFDNTIALNSADRIWIGDVISTMMKGKDKEAKIFSFSMEEFRKQFGEVSKILGIPGLHPYQLRHGGAAHDLASKARDHAQVKARGRWSTDQSVRRYTKTGKIQTLLGQLSKGSLEYCRWSQRNLKSVMSGRMQPKRL